MPQVIFVSMTSRPFGDFGWYPGKVFPNGRAGSTPTIMSRYARQTLLSFVRVLVPEQAQAFAVLALLAGENVEVAILIDVQ